VPRWQRRVASNVNGHDGTVRVTGPFAPLIGALIGTLGGSIYWVAVQIWPSSVAVILSMAATALLTTEIRGALPATRFDVLNRALGLLIKYNAERAAHHQRWESALADWAGPLRLVWGLADPVSGGHVLELAVKALPRAVVTELPDVGHYPSSEAPQAVAAAVRHSH